MKTIALASSSERPSGPIGTVTLAPLLAKAMAAARPMPERPPVIKATGLLMVQSFQVWPPDAGSGGRRVSGRLWRPPERLCRLSFILLRHGQHGTQAPPLFHRRGRGEEHHGRRHAD